MHLTLQSLKHRLFWTSWPLPFQTFAVCLFTRFADPFFFCSIPSVSSLLLHNLQQDVFILSNRGPFFKTGTIYFHIFSSCDSVPLCFTGCYHNSVLRLLVYYIWSPTADFHSKDVVKTTFNFSSQPFVVIATLNLHFLFIQPMAQKISLSFLCLFFYPLALKLYSIPIARPNPILFFTVNFQLLRCL